MVSPRVLCVVMFLASACGKPTVTGSDGGTDVTMDDGGSSTSPDAATCLRSPLLGSLPEDPRGAVTVTAARGDDCLVSYSIDSTAARRDSQPPSPRIVPELPGNPRVRSGNVLFDALYAMALEEVAQNSVDAISDGAFRSGEPTTCEPGGCFETGALWHYVWTRDISYAVELGLAEIDVQRAANSLRFKVSELRDGGGAEVMQDTGTGGGYPVSSDRVVWALGARAVLTQLPADEAREHASWAFDVLLNTFRRDRAILVDARTGLYFGEQSFLDWREQSYPAWVAGRPAHIAGSRSLSTNVLHLRAMEIASELAVVANRVDEASEVAQWASELRSAIRAGFWLENEGLLAGLYPTYLDEAPSRQFDLLGSSLAILFGVVDETEANRIVSAYPHAGVGAPVIFPQQQFTPIYHNRAEWPFVSAYWLRAANVAGNHVVSTRMFETLVRGAALNLSNMENWEIVSGAPFVEDGEFSGPVVNSQRQLWSVAGFVSLTHQSLFGLQPDWQDGPVLRVAPGIPASIREAWFANSDTLTLQDYRYRGLSLTVTLALPALDPASDGFYVVDEILVDGEPLSTPIPAVVLRDGSRIEVRLTAPTETTAELRVVDTTNWRDLFAPRPPVVSAITEEAGRMRLNLESTEPPESIRWNVYRDGVLAADALPGETTSWTEDAPAGASPCYVAEVCFVETGHCSQHSEPQCWWGTAGERVTTFSAASFQNEGGVLSQEYGREHWSQWGDRGHRLVLPGVQPASSGAHLLQVTYGNGAGSVQTGITCGVKHLAVIDEASGDPVAEGFLVMPHLGDWATWGLSTFVPAQLDAARTYRVELSSDAPFAWNMSDFAHFNDYTAGPGGEAPFNRTNIAELRLLAR